MGIRGNLHVLFKNMVVCQLPPRRYIGSKINAVLARHKLSLVPWDVESCYVFIGSSLFPSKSTLGVLEWLHPLHTTPQLSTTSGAEREDWETTIEAAQISGGKAAPAATTTWLPVTAQHSPALDLGCYNRERDVNLGCFWARCLHRWDTGILWPHRPYLLQDSPEAHSRATEHDQTTLKPSIQTTGECTPLPIGWWQPWSWEEALPHIQHRL